jgi:hypothetical protein
MASVSEGIRQQQLSSAGDIRPKEYFGAWNGMSSQFAVIAIVLPSEAPGGCSTKPRRPEELLAFFSRTTKPQFSVTITRFEGPCEVLNLNQLTDQCRTGVVSSFGEEQRATPNQFRSNAEEECNRYGFVAAVTPRRGAAHPIAR